MAVPTGQASFLDIQNEHGGSNPIGLNEYYGVAAGVPGSGQISVDDLRGTSAGDNVAVTQARYNIIVGSNWQDGFSTAVPYGSHSGTVNGATMRSIYQSQSEFKGAWTYQFVVQINGTRAQTFFDQIQLTDVAGDPVLLRANATYSQESGYAQWIWFLGSAYSEWDGSGVQNVLFT